jgi:hypothetical protein
MRKVRENIIVTSGDQAVFAADADVFNCPNEQGVGATVNVLPGQLAIYDPVTLKGLGPGIDVLSNPTFVVGSGIDITGNGTSDTLRKSYGDVVFGKYINAATADTSKCGIPAITDIHFKCTFHDESYTIEIQVQDEQSDNEYPYNTYATYVYTVKTDEIDCGECSADHQCEVLRDAFVDAINGVRKNKSRKTSFFTPKPDPSPKFTATPLLEFSHDFCLTTQSPNACDECTHFDGVVGVTGAELEDGAVTFTNTVDPSNPTLSLDGQMATIIDQLNAALGDLGKAVPVEPTGECCDLRIQVNTSIADLELTGAAGAIAPCSTVDPRMEGYCGIRLIQHLPQPNYNCKYPDLPGIKWLSGDLDVYAKDGFSRGSVKTVKTQESSRPEGMGYQWVKREYWQDNGGHGRDYEPYIDSHGTLGLPLDSERVQGVTANAKTSYVSYILEHSIPNTNNGVSSPRRDARGRTIILVPVGDLNTQASLEAILNPYLESVGFKPITNSVAYDTGLVDDLGAPILTNDQDQLEGTAPDGTYPNANGSIL